MPYLPFFRTVLVFVCVSMVCACDRIRDYAETQKEGRGASSPTAVPATPALPEIPPDEDFAELLSAADTLKAGMSESELRRLAGPPNAEVELGDRQMLMFHGVMVTVKDGVVIEMPPGFADRVVEGAESERKSAIARRKEAEAERAREKERRPVVARGGASRPKMKTFEVGQKSANVGRKISNGGRRVNLSQYTGGGQVTIVDFYADWCGPCRKMEPMLKEIARKHGARLVQIDIVKWGTPVTRQFSIRGIPNIRVFDKRGRMVGDPTHSSREVQQLVAQASGR